MDIIIETANVHSSPVVSLNSLEYGGEQFVPFRKIFSIRRCWSNALTFEIIIKVQDG